MESDSTVPLLMDCDIVAARQRGRALSEKLGFSTVEQAIISTAISELARNILEYAKKGEVSVGEIEDGGRRGIIVIARDGGPGIPDIAKAMQDGFSTRNSLGLGLPSTRRLMDEFDIVSVVGKGTTVIVKKWLRYRESGNP